MHVRQDRERIEQVARDHLGRIAHGRKVVGRVPALQQFDVVEQLPDRRIVERELKFRNTGAQALPQRFAVGHDGTDEKTGGQYQAEWRPALARRAMLS